MGLSNIVDQLHNQYSFSYTSSTKKTNFSSFGIGRQHIYDFDSCSKNLLLDTHLNKLRSFTMNWSKSFTLNRPTFINRFSNNIHNPPKSFRTNWNTDWGTSILNCLSSDQTFSSVHSNGSDNILS